MRAWKTAQDALFARSEPSARHAMPCAALAWIARPARLFGGRFRRWLSRDEVRAENQDGRVRQGLNCYRKI